eukprot:CAMPEP_0177603288 /NCGR_PEP_ID=MMETSP0419_2-20121207/15425_1 /TAXON_ID=582737 /ORGANISM="Tetraselmis sp., Strain GSL018" /LENGTH=840 /DNA_ID=CAMNT_0019097035 /DNA_START=36 /DNA_END=2556 /DNA_ORIENTATION=+
MAELKVSSPRQAWVFEAAAVPPALAGRETSDEDDSGRHQNSANLVPVSALDAFPDDAAALSEADTDALSWKGGPVVVEEGPVRALEERVALHLRSAPFCAEPRVWLLGQQPEEELSERGAQRLVARERQLLLQDVVKCLIPRFTPKRSPPEDELVAQYPERPPVDRSRVPCPLDDLRGNVLLCAHERVRPRRGVGDELCVFPDELDLCAVMPPAGGHKLAVSAAGDAAAETAPRRQRRHALVLGLLLDAGIGRALGVCQVEVGEDHVAVVHENVLRLQVTVNVAKQVEVLERQDYLRGVEPQLTLAELADGGHQLVEVAALAAPHDVVDVCRGADRPVAERQEGVVDLREDSVLGDDPRNLVPVHHVLLGHALYGKDVARAGELHEVDLARGPVAEVPHRSEVLDPQVAVLRRLHEELVAPVRAAVVPVPNAAREPVQLLKGVPVRHEVLQRKADALRVEQRLGAVVGALLGDVDDGGDDKLAHPPHVLHGEHVGDGGEGLAAASVGLDQHAGLRHRAEEPAELLRVVRVRIGAQQEGEVSAEDGLAREADHPEENVRGKHDGAFLHARIADHKRVLEPLHGGREVERHPRDSALEVPHPVVRDVALPHPPPVLAQPLGEALPLPPSHGRAPPVGGGDPSGRRVDPRRHLPNDLPRDLGGARVEVHDAPVGKAPLRAPRHVDLHPNELDRLPGAVLHRRHGEEVPEGLAGLLVVEEPDGHRVTPPDRRLQLLHRGAVRLLALQEPAVPPEDLVELVACELEEALAGVGDGAVRLKGVGDDEGVREAAQLLVDGALGRRSRVLRPQYACRDRAGSRLGELAAAVQGAGHRCDAVPRGPVRL